MMTGNPTSLTCDRNLTFVGKRPNCTVKNDSFEIEVSGSMNLIVDNKAAFCADQILLNVVKKALVTSANSESQGGNFVEYDMVNVTCAPDRRLHELSAGRRLEENVTLDYKIRQFASQEQRESQGSMLVSSLSSITQQSLSNNLNAEVQKLGNSSLSIKVSSITQDATPRYRDVSGSGDFVPSPTSSPTPSPSPRPAAETLGTDEDGASSKIRFLTAMFFIASVALVMPITM
jgi:hypothetical protein